MKNPENAIQSILLKNTRPIKGYLRHERSRITKFALLYTIPKYHCTKFLFCDMLPIGGAKWVRIQHITIP